MPPLRGHFKRGVADIGMPFISRAAHSDLVGIDAVCKQPVMQSWRHTGAPKEEKNDGIQGLSEAT